MVQLINKVKWVTIKFFIWISKGRVYYKGGFDCKCGLISLFDIGAKSCTYRPSLSLTEISRNIVDVPEGASRSSKV